MKYIIDECDGLDGEIQTYGAKNCALALLAAATLTDEDVVLHNCPQITDVENMAEIIRRLGGKATRLGGDLFVNCKNITSTEIPAEYANRLRGSALFLGPLTARFGTASMPHPGGCAIGSRPMDIHLDGLRAMGAELIEDDSITCKTAKLQGTTYTLRFASVGATENLITAATLAEGVTVLKNCACEPEVAALCRFLNCMGANVAVEGGTVTVCGVKKLHGTEFTVIPDRIVAATYLAACAAAGGRLTVTKCNPAHIAAFTEVLKKYHTVREYSDAVEIVANPTNKGYGGIVTAPYPQFPTDAQSLLLTLAATSNGGVTVITEKLFENRLAHNASELNAMGAKIVVTGDAASVVGVGRLKGAEVTAKDLRGGAALVVAGLCAKGVTVVDGVEHIERGYVALDRALNGVGACITTSG